MKGVGAFHLLIGGFFRVNANLLADLAKFVAVGSVPGCTQPGVAAESAMLQCLTSFGVNHSEG